MYQFNIYAAYPKACGDADEHNVQADVLAHQYFPDGWTRISTTGGWHDQTELGIVYQVLLTNCSPRPWSVAVFADKLRALFVQQAVLVTRQPVESYLISEEGKP